MKKILMFSLFVVSLFSFPLETNYKIVDSSNKFATINGNVLVGSSGIVVHNNIIIALAEAVSKNKLKYLPYTNLTNRALATPKITPKVGDTIKMYHDYNRALIIAPNQEAYLNIKSKLKDVVDSDLFVAMASDVTELEKKDFQKFCKAYDVGIVYFDLDKNYIVDCNTFKIIETTPNKTKPIYKKPLFSSYQLDKSDTNYINYYKNLIKAK